MADYPAILARYIERLRLRRRLYDGAVSEAYRVAIEILMEEAVRADVPEEEPRGDTDVQRLNDEPSTT